jgi:hypothetical protein
MYSYQHNTRAFCRCHKLASLLLSNNALVRRPLKLFRGHHLSPLQQQQQQPSAVYIRSVATNSTNETEYKNFSHKLLTVEQVHPSMNRETLQQDKLVFGKQFTPHMLQIQYSHQQWSAPKIVPYQNLTMSPAASSLHYGTFFVNCV